MGLHFSRKVTRYLRLGVPGAFAVWAMAYNDNYRKVLTKRKQTTGRGTFGPVPHPPRKGSEDEEIVTWISSLPAAPSRPSNKSFPAFRSKTTSTWFWVISF